ncbi:hypothetical protein [Luteimicrobium subarcticum]|uniref:DUF2975 family protein n=1 Tax=Luteimicrobium subarcticum TaxID=620910 RepID=A0A2M8WRM9_9MICO|nr:hypothetical protein [Luteimicrobium subarcticum]PJI93592.1 hypothetical protein CLV34_1064 [Luteimicrobium subarcticum]
MSAPARRRPTGDDRVRARGESVALEVLLWGILLVVLVTQVIRPVVGPDGLGWYDGASVEGPPSITVTLDPAVVDTMTVPPTLPTLDDTAGAVSPGQVEIVPSRDATVTFWSPTFRQLAAADGQELVDGLVAAAVLALVILVVRDLRHGELFTSRNLRRGYAVAATVAGGGMLAQAVGTWGRIGVLESPQVAPYARLEWTVSWGPLVAGLAVFVAVEAVRQGVQLRRDVEGLV